MQILVKNKYTLLYDEFEFKCSVGKRGITSKKIEGDLKTPRGSYSLGPVYYRKDRMSKPVTKLKIISIQKEMGWCDDVNSKYYNKLIKVNKKIRHEKLYRKSRNYDLLIPINYNTSHPKKNKGSAIFFHLTKNYQGTMGCISLKLKDMLILLKIIKKNTKIKIV
jgi:L,D-peptidoglycan transpeptidase YkuD (ErfK/YbiS/YcfS/YnhG family)